jgi:ABC-type glycerol-3-phosphate transport system permease component
MRAVPPSVFIRSALSYILLALLAFSMLFPFWFMFIGGFRVTSQINSTHFTFVPEYGFGYLDNFNTLFFKSPYPRALLNTFLTATIRMALNLFLSSLAGFAFEKIDFPGKGKLFFFVLATMMIPSTVMLIPNYVTMVKLHWLDSWLPIIVPGMVSAWGIFIMRQYMQAIPNEVIYYSRIDGCNDFQSFLYIAFPMVQPGLIVVSIILFMGAWNDFFWPLIVLNNQELHLVSQVLSTFKGNYQYVDYGTVLAGSFISALPMIAIFVAFRNRLLTGLVSGSIK